MYVILLFTLTKSKIGIKSTLFFAVLVFILNFGSTLYFYVYSDLTLLSRFSIVMFIVVGLAIKPLTKLNFMQWVFTFLTTINIGMMIVILSFHLSRVFPFPQYAHTIIRLALYIVAIYIIKRYFLTYYESILMNWSIFSGLLVIIFLNLSYYFYFTDDIEETLTTSRWPLLLLVTLSLAAYGTVFYALKKMTAIKVLETEKLEIQKESGRLYEVTMQLEKYANYDMLTGLPNRRFFFEKLDGVIRESERDASKFVLFYIDLDGFKDINDKYGHEVGDEVLITVGNRLLKGIRRTDFVARLGGDEFAIIIHDIIDIADVENLAKKIHEMLQEIMHIGTIQCIINSSIGIAIYPDTGTTSETLLRHADRAMYDIKRKGKAGIGFFKNP